MKQESLGSPGEAGGPHVTPTSQGRATRGQSKRLLQMGGPSGAQPSSSVHEEDSSSQRASTTALQDVIPTAAAAAALLEPKKARGRGVKIEDHTPAQARETRVREGRTQGTLDGC